MLTRATVPVALVFLSFAPIFASAENFSGKWEAGHDTISAFSLDLTQSGTSISGYHCAVAYRGNRIDCTDPADGSASIRGTVSGSVAHVHFQSAYREDAEGDATLRLRDGKLYWHVDRSSGAHYLPHVEILTRAIRNGEKSPNQAMQRTAGRTAIPLSMTSPLSLQATLALASGR